MSRLAVAKPFGEPGQHSFRLFVERKRRIDDPAPASRPLRRWWVDLRFEPERPEEVSMLFGILLKTRSGPLSSDRSLLAAA
jgi:hypothetical protein